MTSFGNRVPAGVSGRDPGAGHPGQERETLDTDTCWSLIRRPQGGGGPEHGGRDQVRSCQPGAPGCRGHGGLGGAVRPGCISPSPRCPSGRAVLPQPPAHRRCPITNLEVCRETPGGKISPLSAPRRPARCPCARFWARMPGLRQTPGTLHREGAAPGPKWKTAAAIPAPAPRGGVH